MRVIGQSKEQVRGRQRQMDEGADSRVGDNWEKDFREYIEIRARKRLSLSGSCGWI